MVAAAEFIGRTWGCSVLLKGGHSVNDANDLLWTQDRYQWIRGERIDTPNTHGTGCTLSSAIAANLAKGFHLEDSVRRAKEYLAGALNAGRNLGLGHGIGPVHHAFDLHSRFAQTCENA